MDHAFRVSFDLSPDGAEVASVRRVAMRVPAGQAKPDSDKVRAQVGWFVELRDADQRILYRRPLRQEFAESVEVRTGVSDPQFKRVEAAGYRRREAVLVPDLPRRACVVVCENRMQKKTAKAKQATLQTLELLSVDLPALDKGAES